MRFLLSLRQRGIAVMQILSVMVMLVVLMSSASVLAEQDTANADSESAQGSQVIHEFNRYVIDESDIVKVSEEKKHKVLFFMGISLLILLLATAVFGVRSGVFGKQEFLQHMICAGLSVTLAIAHAVAAMVWFFPF